MSTPVFLQRKTGLILWALVICSLTMGVMALMPQKANAAPPCDGAANGLVFVGATSMGRLALDRNTTCMGRRPAQGCSLRTSPNLLI